MLATPFSGGPRFFFSRGSRFSFVDELASLVGSVVSAAGAVSVVVVAAGVVATSPAGSLASPSFGAPRVLSPRRYNLSALSLVSLC